MYIYVYVYSSSKLIGNKHTLARAAPFEKSLALPRVFYCFIVFVFIVLLFYWYCFIVLLFYCFVIIVLLCYCFIGTVLLLYCFRERDVIVFRSSTSNHIGIT